MKCLYLCIKLGICYEDNSNARRKHLWKDGLHLVESGKVILASKFFSYLRKCFFNTHTSSEGIYLDDYIRNAKPGVSASKYSFMDKISEKGIETKIIFWDFIKPFVTNKGMIASKGINLVTRKLSSQMSMRFQRHLTSIILTLSKEVAATNLIQ